MRYVKALVLLCIFFLVMVFLFQNQASLSQKLAFQLDLMVMPAMTSIQLPFYFVLLLAFLLGAVLCLLLLVWDRMRMSAEIMRASFKVQAIQNEERKLLAQMEKLAAAPKESRLKLFSGFKKKDQEKEEAIEAKADPAADEARKAEINEFFKETSADGVESTQATEPEKPAEAKAEEAKPAEAKAA